MKHHHPFYKLTAILFFVAGILSLFARGGKTFGLLFLLLASVFTMFTITLSRSER